MTVVPFARRSAVLVGVVLALVLASHAPAQEPAPPPMPLADAVEVTFPTEGMEFEDGSSVIATVTTSATGFDHVKVTTVFGYQDEEEPKERHSIVTVFDQVNRTFDPIAAAFDVRRRPDLEKHPGHYHLMVVVDACDKAGQVRSSGLKVITLGVPTPAPAPPP